MAKGKVGIVGLGIMGGAFARNLVTAGWRVVGYDIDANRCRATARAGAEIAPDAKALAAEVKAIITSLPKPAALDATVDAIIQARVSPRVIIEASTFAIDNVASAEAMVLGLKAGLDAQTVFDMVRSGAANSRVFELRAPMMVKDRYDDVSMKISVWQKDMAVIGEFAHSLGCPTPMFDSSVPIYERAMRGGHAAHDTAAVCAVLEKMAGVKRQTKQRPKRA